MADRSRKKTQNGKDDLPDPGKPARGRPRGKPKVTPEEAVGALQREVIAEGDLPAREQAVVLGRTLYTQWLGGRTYASLAEEHGLHWKHVSEVVDEYRRAKIQVMPGPASALMTIHGFVSRLEHAVSQYAELAESESVKKQPGVKLAAMKQRDEAQAKLVALHQELGWIPRQLGVLRIHSDAVQMVDAILDEMDKAGIPIDTQRRIVEAVEMRAIERGGRVGVELADEPLEGTASEVAA
jgi:hypothetical protein